MRDVPIGVRDVLNGVRDVFIGVWNILIGVLCAYAVQMEAKILFAASGPQETALDDGSGQAVSPEDSARLREKIGTLSFSAPLLKPLGSMAPIVKDACVFDFGGNGAEGCAVNGTNGYLAVGCALQPAGSFARWRLNVSERVIDPAYGGFRVLREKADPPAPKPDG